MDIEDLLPFAAAKRPGFTFGLRDETGPEEPEIARTSPPLLERIMISASLYPYGSVWGAFL
jgi:hypothetical protein